MVCAMRTPPFFYRALCLVVLALLFASGPHPVWALLSATVATDHCCAADTSDAHESADAATCQDPGCRCHSPSPAIAPTASIPASTVEAPVTAPSVLVCAYPSGFISTIDYPPERL
jgi:hypothetical protein